MTEKTMINNIPASSETSRRNLLFGAGIAGAALTAVRANAQSPAPPPNADVSILNYALTLEHLEANFYTEGLNRLKVADFSNSTLAKVVGPGTIAGVYTNLGRIRDHEVAHVGALQTAIRSLGGTPVAPCTYKFTYTNADQFLQVALSLEELGVQAYDGAIAMLTAAALKTAGASIATVEARHAAYLQLLNSSIPFPKAFDETKMMREVLAMASGFIASCGTTPVGMATTAILMPKNLTTFERLVQLDATQSISGTGQPLTYELKLVSGAAAVLEANNARPWVQLSGGAGEYTFEVVVTDSSGTKAMDRVTINYAGN